MLLFFYAIRDIYLELHDIIRRHEADVALHADHLPPVPLAGTGLVQDKVLAFVEADRLRVNGRKVVQRLQHLEALCKNGCNKTRKNN